MSKSTISTFQLFEMFPDQETARHTLERLGSFIDGVAGKRLTYKALIA